MADLKISQMTDGANIAGANTLIEIAQGSNSRSLKFSDLFGPCVIAKAGTNQAVTGNAWTIVNFPTEDLDSHGVFNGNTFQPGTNYAGVYAFSALVETANVASFGIFKNNGFIKYGIGQGSIYNFISGQIQLSGSDYIDFRVYPSASCNVTGGTSSGRVWVDIHRVYKV